MIGISGFFFLLKKILRKDHSPVNIPILGAFICLIVISLVSFFNTINLKSSIHGIEKLLKYGILFVTVADSLKDKKHLKWILFALISGLVMASLDGFYSMVFGKDLFRQMPPNYVIGLIRIRAAFPDANLFAGYLALFSPVLLGITLYHVKGRLKGIMLLVSVLVLVNLIFTLSRSAIFGVWLALLFMGILKRDKVIIFLLILSLLITPFIMPRQIKGWINSSNSIWEVLLNGDSQSAGRLPLFKVALEMIKSHPFIGVGVNTFSINFKIYKAIGKIDFPYPGDWYAHNIYLHLPAEIGLVGLAIFLYMLFLIFKTWVKFNRETQDAFLKISGMGIIAGIIAFLVNGLTETNLYNPKVATLLFFMIGLFFGVNKIAKGVVYEKKQN